MSIIRNVFMNGLYVHISPRSYIFHIRLGSVCTHIRSTHTNYLLWFVSNTIGGTN
jgi:hypothetical protein